MKRRIRFSIRILFLFFVFFSNTNYSPLLSQDYFPYEEGDSWIYKVYNLNTDIFIREDSNVISDKMIINDTVCYTFKQYFDIPDIQDSLIQLLAEIPEEENNIYFKFSVSDTFYKVFQHTYNIGDTLHHGPNQNIVFTVSYFGDYITNEGIKYEDCLKLGDDENINYYIAPDIGIVAGEDFIEVDKSELTRWDFTTSTQQPLPIIYQKKSLIYPNPVFDGKFSINLPINNVKQFKIYNAAGQFIFSDKNTTNIQIENLKPGIYLILIRSDKNLIYISKFISI